MIIFKGLTAQTARIIVSVRKYDLLPIDRNLLNSFEGTVYCVSVCGTTKATTISTTRTLSVQTLQHTLCDSLRVE